MITEENPDNLTIQPADVNIKRYNALMITGIILPFLLYPFLSLIILSYTPDYTSRLFVSRLLIWAVVGLMYFFARQAEVQGFLLWPDKYYKLSFYLKAIGALYLLGIAAGAIAHIPTWLGMHEDNRVMVKAVATLQRYPLLLIFSAITAGVTEELVFRGYILSRLSLFFKNKHVAVLISALLFAAIHLSYKTLNELIFAFLIGVIYAYHYQKYRNIQILIITHFLVDVIAMAIFKVHK